MLEKWADIKYLSSALKSKTRINLYSHWQVDKYYVAMGAETLLVVFLEDFRLSFFAYVKQWSLFGTSNGTGTVV